VAGDVRLSVPRNAANDVHPALCFLFLQQHSGCFGTATFLIGASGAEFELYFIILARRPSEEVMQSV
jgi:hypothetical protein